ncbi:tyrosine protein phosphatase [Weissella muntiaci]|uniref:Tyrosine-protein phosphatase n=1 Tax=Weissella muntiaci TaxID=2508881 RepID=A0A6C2C9U1_9LACO|nr:CpsB/CapC family capsule biosynthesis tyrosine phosphatase [Weissella muntiaci]TYC50687.1 tyrosine protein phosphatase [Weissella muntiaci]
MIDIHSHLLPGIDDGVADWEGSLQLARLAVKDGITHALMTPHHLNGQYVNPASKVIALTEEFQSKLDQAKIKLQVYPSQEIRINGNLIDSLEKGELLTTDEQGGYMLIEFPSNDVPAFTTEVLFELQQHGVAPVIVHPERNQMLMDKPSILYDLIQRGAYAQVTANSYVGVFGKAVMAFSEDIIGQGLAHVLASDAHLLKGRGYNMAAAFDKLAEQVGDKEAVAFAQNARAFVNGTDVERFNASPIKKRRLFSAY